MLILSRKENEQIVFPQLGIRVKVAQVRGRVVRLGVEAPRHISVLRHELAPQLPGSDTPVPATPQRPLRHVLLVEDSANEREMLASVLRMRGYHVDVAADGREAIDYLSAQERPDVVLLDMQMPRMNGAQTLAAIRANPRLRGLKVCAVSGADRSQLGISIDPKGVNRWFSKPFDLRAFLANLDEELNSITA